MKKQPIIEAVADEQKNQMVMRETLPLFTIGVQFDVKNGKPDLRNCFKSPVVVAVIDGITPEMVNTALHKALKAANKVIVEKSKLKKLN